MSQFLVQQNYLIRTPQDRPQPNMRELPALMTIDHATPVPDYGSASASIIVVGRAEAVLTSQNETAVRVPVTNISKDAMSISMQPSMPQGRLQAHSRTSIINPGATVDAFCVVQVSPSVDKSPCIDLIVAVTLQSSKQGLTSYFFADMLSHNFQFLMSVPAALN